MKRTRRHKHFQLAVFFLTYSIIHVVSSSNTNTDAPKSELDKSPRQSDDKYKAAHEHILKHLDVHLNSALKGKNSSETPTQNDKSSIQEGHRHVLNNLDKHLSSIAGPVPSREISNSSKANATAHHDVMTQAPGVLSEKNMSTEAHNITEHETVVNTLDKHLAVVVGGVTKGVEKAANETITEEEECTPPAIRQFPHPLMSPTVRRHGGLIIHIIVAMYMFLGLAIVCDEYFVASLDRICEELKMTPDVAGATFMAAGSSAPELATVIIGVFFAKDDIGISGVIGSAVFNIMFVIACCGLCSTTAVYLNWWPLVRDCFFYAISILVMLGVIYDKTISWIESLIMLFTYLIYCIVLHFNTPLEKWAQSWPVPFKKIVPSEQSGLVSYKTLEEDGKHQNYGMEWTPEKPQDEGMKNFGMEWSPEKHQQEGFIANQLSGPDLNQATIDAPSAPTLPARPMQQDYYKPKEYDPAAHVNPLIKPEGGIYVTGVWMLVFPIHWLCRKTMPDCRSEKYRNWYPFTFFVSMVWISFYSYFMVWMITVIGYTLGIPDTVMGLTFVAAGVSVPDALSSIAVIKEGYGDMAVSNAVGSNVFDILICLGLPWFIKTAIIRPGSTVKVISKGLTYSTLSLLSTVVFLVVATHSNGWKLDRRYGVVLMIWYLVFITFASMYELNVFGYLNPPECTTDW